MVLCGRSLGTCLQIEGLRLEQGRVGTRVFLVERVEPRELPRPMKWATSPQACSDALAHDGLARSRRSGRARNPPICALDRQRQGLAAQSPHAERRRVRSQPQLPPADRLRQIASISSRVRPLVSGRKAITNSVLARLQAA